MIGIKLRLFNDATPRANLTGIQAIYWDAYPAWTEDTEYQIGELCKHNAELYKVNQTHTSQAIYPPGSEGVSALYSRAVPDSVIPDWVQPQGSHDTYGLNEQVTHVGKVWRSNLPFNDTEPGQSLEFGWWTEVV